MQEFIRSMCDCKVLSPKIPDTRTEAVAAAQQETRQSVYIESMWSPDWLASRSV